MASRDGAPLSKLAALCIADEGQAARRVLRAFDRGGGSRKRAAILLNVPYRTMYMVIRRLNLWADIDELLRRRGYANPHAELAARRRVKLPKQVCSYVDDVCTAAPQLIPRVAPSTARLPIRFDVFDPSLADRRAEPFREVEWP